MNSACFRFHKKVKYSFTSVLFFHINEKFIIPVNTNLGALLDPMDNDGEIIYVNYDEILTKSIKSPKINQEMCGIFLDVRKKSRDYYLYNKMIVQV